MQTEVRSAGPWLFFCAGMRRGGSTLQAQLVSALLDDARIEAISAESFREMMSDRVNIRTPVVCKCHEFLPELARLQAEDIACVFYVYRDIRDVVASISKKYSIPAFSFIHGGVLPILDEFEQWSGVPGAYIGCYESMLADLPAEVRKLGAHMGMSIDDARAKKIAAEFSLDRQRARIGSAFADPAATGGLGLNAYDDRTLLHRNHIQSGGSGAFRRVLSWHEIAALEWVTRDWMSRTGYRPEYSALVQALAYGWFAFRAALHKARVRVSGSQA